jgi:hypothetical protein
VGTGGRDGPDASAGGQPDAGNADATSGNAGGQPGTGGRSAGGQLNTGGLSTGGQPSTGGAGGGSGGTGGRCPARVLTGDVTALDESDVGALYGYTEITGALYIGTNISTPVNNTKSLESLQCLETVGGEITILETPGLTSLAGLENLRSAESLKISDMPGLTTLAGPTALTLTSTLLVERNATLTALGSGIVAAPDIYLDGNDILTQCEIDRFLATVQASTCTCTGTGTAGPCP